MNLGRNLCHLCHHMPMHGGSVVWVREDGDWWAMLTMAWESGG